jgi:hypothetical protein
MRRLFGAVKAGEGPRRVALTAPNRQKTIDQRFACKAEPSPKGVPDQLSFFDVNPDWERATLGSRLLR